MTHLAEEQLDALLNGLTEAARKVRKERYGKNVAVKPKIIDLLVRIARIHQGDLPSKWLHQYAEELDAERAAHQATRAELEATRTEREYETQAGRYSIQSLRSRIYVAS